MSPTSLLILAAAGASTATTLPAAAPAATGAAQYEVSVRMQEGDSPATNPRLTTASGQTATFEIANDSYDLRMTATPDADGHVMLASSLSSWTPHGLANDAKILRLEADGNPGTLSFAHTDPGTGIVRPIRLEIRIRPAG